MNASRLLSKQRETLYSDDYEIRKTILPISAKSSPRNNTQKLGNFLKQIKAARPKTSHGIMNMRDEEINEYFNSLFKKKKVHYYHGRGKKKRRTPKTQFIKSPNLNLNFLANRKKVKAHKKRLKLRNDKGKDNKQEGSEEIKLSNDENDGNVRFDVIDEKKTKKIEKTYFRANSKILSDTLEKRNLKIPLRYKNYRNGIDKRIFKIIQENVSKEIEKIVKNNKFLSEGGKKEKLTNENLKELKEKKIRAKIKLVRKRKKEFHQLLSKVDLILDEYEKLDFKFKSSFENFLKPEEIYSLIEENGDITRKGILQQSRNNVKKVMDALKEVNKSRKKFIELLADSENKLESNTETLKVEDAHSESYFRREEIEKEAKKVNDKINTSSKRMKKSVVKLKEYFKEIKNIKKIDEDEKSNHIKKINEMEKNLNIIQKNLNNSNERVKYLKERLEEKEDEFNELKKKIEKSQNEVKRLKKMNKKLKANLKSNK